MDIGLSPDLLKLQTERAKQIRRSIFNPKKRNLCISGPVGTSKTFTILPAIHMICMMQPGTKVAIARAEKTTLYSTLIPSFRKVLKDGLKNCEIFDVLGGERRPQEIFYKNGSHVLFTGADNDKIFGGEFSIVYLNELRLLDDVTYSDIAARLRGGGYRNGAGKECYLLVSDTNPGGPTSWIKNRESNDQLILIPTNLEDNPMYYQNGEWTPEGIEYKQVLLESYGTSGWQYDRYVRGLWVAAENIVWPEYDPKEHEIEFEFEDIPKNWKWFGSADYGYNHPAVYQLWARSPDHKQAWMFKEIYRTGLTDHRLAEQIKILHGKYGLTKVHDIQGDSAGDGNQTLQDAELPAVDANKDILYGVDAVRQWFRGVGDRKVRFNKNSLSHEPDRNQIDRGKPTKTVEEFAEYSYKPLEKQTSGTYRDDLPDKQKGDDDGCDATRYRLVSWITPTGYYRSPRRRAKMAETVPSYMR